MPPKAGERGAAESAFQVLLNYATAANHKLEVKHAASAAGIALSTAFARIAAAKKNVDKTLSSQQLAGGLPVLVKYSELSGHKLAGKHVASAAGIAVSTAFARIAQAKSEAKKDAPLPELDLELSIEASSDAPKGNSRRSRQSNVSADSDGKELSDQPKKGRGRPRKGDVTGTPKVKDEEGKVTALNQNSSSVVIPSSKMDDSYDIAKNQNGRKRKTRASKDEEIEHEEAITAPKAEAGFAVVIDARAPEQNKSSDSQVKGETEIKEAAETTNNNEAASISGANGQSNVMEQTNVGQPPKKRGRPPKKAKIEASSVPTEPNGGEDIKMTDDDSFDVADNSNGQGIIQGDKDEHVEATLAERSLDLDGVSEGQKKKEMSPDVRNEQPVQAKLEDETIPTDLDMLDSSHKSPDVVHGAVATNGGSVDMQTTGDFGTKNEQMMLATDVNGGIDQVTDVDVKNHSEDSGIDELMDQFIDISKGEAAAEEARKVIGEKFAWPFE